MKYLALVIIAFSFSAVVFGQNNNENQNKQFDTPRDGLSIDVDLMSVEFIGTIGLKSRTKLGFGIQLGTGVRFIINNPTYLYCGGGCDSGDCCANGKLKAAYYGHMEVARFKLFW